MLKVGIITQYYKSLNFGGNLQAYALCEFLSRNFDVEQICYPLEGVNLLYQPNFFKRLHKSGIKKAIKTAFKILNSKFQAKLTANDRLVNKIKERKVKAFSIFNSNIIPHSANAYNNTNIIECQNYDKYVVGSDQVWNLYWCNDAYLLSFVENGKDKLSYAASLGKKEITQEEKELYKEHLKDFKAISVREKDAVDLLKDITQVEPQHVVDPTLLLERGDWDKVCSERQINDKYIICYFLGDNKKARKAAQKLAKEKGLKLINIAYAGGNNAYFNIKFGDIKLYDASPQDFISLIKHAEYVFTDSFHAVVFSYIYQKQYFVFNRDKSGSMNSRIYSITELFNQPERFCFCKDREKFEYVNNLNDADYSIKNEKLEQMIEKSKKFLLDNLN